jgi:hypothetical protein
MSEQNEFITPNQRRQQGRELRSAELIRRFIATEAEHLRPFADKLAMDWLRRHIGLSEEADNLATSYIMHKDFTQRQLRFIRARMERRSAAT